MKVVFFNLGKNQIICSEPKQPYSGFRKWRFICTCAPALWLPAAHAAAAVCLYADSLRLSGCPTLSSGPLPCSPTAGGASSEENQGMFYECLTRTIRSEWPRLLSRLIRPYSVTLWESLCYNKEWYFKRKKKTWVNVYNLYRKQQVYLLSLLASSECLSVGDAFFQRTQCSLVLCLTAAGLLQLLGQRLTPPLQLLDASL